MESRDKKREAYKRKSNITKKNDLIHKRKLKLRKRKRKIILSFIIFSIIVSTIYYPKYKNYLSIPNKEVLSTMFIGKKEFLLELNNIKDSLSKFYLTKEEEDSINNQINKLKDEIKNKSNKELKSDIDKIKSQLNDISAKNQIDLEEEYSRINDEVLDNYTEEENNKLDEYRDAYEDAFNEKDFYLAQSKLDDLKIYIKDTNKIANERRITEVYNEKSNEDPSTREVSYVNGILVANKEHALPEDFAPGESPEARAAFEEMKVDAQNEGIYLNAFSTYRSYWRQDRLYNNYAYEYGSENADTFSARAGFSEHQTGLAFDIGGLDRSLWAQDGFRDTVEAKWLAENAYKYGFILRYPEGKEWITGYQYESWHFRYIGVENSINFKDNNLTLEEYLGLVKN